ncbi:SMP-30/Gluconolactonase/LRE-like region [compost metagenome]
MRSYPGAVLDRYPARHVVPTTAGKQGAAAVAIARATGVSRCARPRAGCWPWPRGWRSFASPTERCGRCTSRAPGHGSQWAVSGDCMLICAWNTCRCRRWPSPTASPSAPTAPPCTTATRPAGRSGDALDPPRLFVDLGEVPGVPDGSCIDAQGHLWNAQWGLGRVVRYSPDGAQQGIWPVPTRQPTRPAFGGPLLDTLYVTSARDGLSADSLASDPHADALFRCQPGVCGLAETRFAGAP